MTTDLQIADILAAAERIAPHVLRTPTLRHQVRDDLTVFAKAESLQPIGAFKLRGAFNMLLASELPSGVVAHSSGNHAQAVARAAKVLGIDACIVMPDNAPPLKRAQQQQGRADDELRYEVGRKTVTGNTDRWTLKFVKP